MSKTYHCDHCNKMIEYVGSNLCKISTEYSGIYGYSSETYDLCHDCFDKVDNVIRTSLFINNEAKKKKGRKSDV